tara:strand:+ start:345 stop:593 length:249 start_codon:yes stop_codon:yes gene_type:complete
MEVLKKAIDGCDKSQHIEIYKILKKNNIHISENKNGSFVNLSNITDESIINEINEYITHLKTQESELKEKEDKKQEYNVSYF